MPPDQVASYEAKGAKVGVRMTAPDVREKAIVPLDQQDSYQKQGATWDAHPDNDVVKNFMTQRQQQAQTDSFNRTDANMSRALSGQPMSTPQDQAQFEEGKGSGTITGSTILATGALGAGISALTAGSPITTEVATGLVDEFGEPITRETISRGPSILGKGFQTAVQWVAGHPTTAKAVSETAGVAAGMKIVGKMAKPAQEFGHR